MTFSIAARCARTGRFGLAISSSSPAVAARCAHLRAGVGAVASQNVTDPRLGQAALALIAAGAAPANALASLVASRPHIAHRQMTAIDAHGRTAAYSGAGTLGVHAIAEGRDCVAAGNLLAGTDVPAKMVASFERLGDDNIGDRLVAALEAGLAAGGEAGPVHSAGLLIVDTVDWPVTDLRVDWDADDPIGKLAALWAIWKPQEAAYVQRALDPSAAPGFGVPGDETAGRSPAHR
jgi:uncharacterized Ntn-hydrolase superfamily protein